MLELIRFDDNKSLMDNSHDLVILRPTLRVLYGPTFFVGSSGVRPWVLIILLRLRGVSTQNLESYFTKSGGLKPSMSLCLFKCHALKGVAIVLGPVNRFVID
jgi:hypothetical protein